MLNLKDVLVSSNKLEFSMDNPTKYYKVKVSIQGNGTVSCPDGGILCPEGDSVVLKAIPNNNWKVDGWVLDNKVINSFSDVFSINSIDRDYDISLIFSPILSQSITRSEQTDSLNNKTKNTYNKNKKNIISNLKTYFLKLKY